MSRPSFQLPDQRWLERARTRARAALAMPEEGPAEHCRNALAVLRFSIEHDEPLLGNGCPAIAVPITSLARMQARLEAAIEHLEPAMPEVCCLQCRGTILPPTIGGVPRGTCHCLHNLCTED